jgi:diguanylate cyclase (GGDEF)-like protein
MKVVISYISCTVLILAALVSRTEGLSALLLASSSLPVILVAEYRHMFIQSGILAISILLLSLSFPGYLIPLASVLGFAVLGTNYMLRRETEQIQINLSYQVTHDHLTNLPNRRALISYLSRLLSYSSRNSRSFSFLFFDLDRFKRINDSHGHDCGDEVLIKVAIRLRSVIRESDFCCRLGGDEFVIIAPDADKEFSGQVIGQKILDVIREPMHIHGNEFQISASIGIAVYPRDGESWIELLKNADIAMYQAKKSGKDCLRFFSEKMNHTILRSNELERYLLHAFDEQELRVEYQPKIDLKSGRTCGVEALIRWDSPELGSIPPDEFIPLAEENGLIHSIGRWVFRQSMKTLHTLITLGFTDIKMAVNCSPIQFKSHTFPYSLLAIIDEFQINPSLVELEITEGLLMEGEELIKKNLKTLKDRGFRLAVDDFGTGYSSLSYLKEFQVDTLKIDKKFVVKMIQDPDYLSIVKAVISMAENLQLNTIAEGVEVLKQINELKALGCKQIQGFYYSKPLCFSELHLRLEAERKMSMLN